MNPGDLGWIFLTVLGVVTGLGIYLAQPSEDDSHLFARLFPWADVFRRQSMRIVASSVCFAVAIVAFVSWLGY